MGITGGQLEKTDVVSVDLEDYYHVEAFAGEVSRAEWSGFPSRVRQNTERVLRLLQRNHCSATFFVLGWVAEREPGLIHDLVQAGHEVACHSHLHRRVCTLKPSEFREDVLRARGAIEKAGGAPVLGFRAPTFSITRQSLWALEILAELGFKYDSSIFPVRHDLYGFPDAPRGIHRREFPSGNGIWEIPPATLRIAGQNLPVAGGGYLRLFPMTLTRWAIGRIRREGRPVVVYFHPWELDPQQPRLRAGWKSRLRHYTGLSNTERRLDEILARGTFQPMLKFLEQVEQTASYAQAAN